jgi:hypothetical protein
MSDAGSEGAPAGVRRRGLLGSRPRHRPAARVFTARYAMASTIAFSVALGRIAAAVFFASGR